MATQETTVPGNSNEAIDWNSLSDEEFSDTLFEKLESETQSILQKNEPEQIEKFITDDGVSRRIATALLAGRTFKEYMEIISDDREAAVALANAAESINPEPYERIAELLQIAKTRIMVALCGREDMEEIIEEAKKEIQ